jgi:hypothetical protein
MGSAAVILKGESQGATGTPGHPPWPGGPAALLPCLCPQTGRPCRLRAGSSSVSPMAPDSGSQARCGGKDMALDSGWLTVSPAVTLASLVNLGPDRGPQFLYLYNGDTDSYSKPWLGAHHEIMCIK